MKTSLEIKRLLGMLEAEYTSFGGQYFLVTGSDGFDVTELPEAQTTTDIALEEGLALVVGSEVMEDDGSVDWAGCKAFCNLYTGQ